LRSQINRIYAQLDEKCDTSQDLSHRKKEHQPLTLIREKREDKPTEDLRYSCDLTKRSQIMQRIQALYLFEVAHLSPTPAFATKLAALRIQPQLSSVRVGYIFAPLVHGGDARIPIQLLSRTGKAYEVACP
jgi:hypothetical protein